MNWPSSSTLPTRRSSEKYRYFSLFLWCDKELRSQIKSVRMYVFTSPIPLWLSQRCCRRDGVQGNTGWSSLLYDCFNFVNLYVCASPLTFAMEIVHNELVLVFNSCFFFTKILTYMRFLQCCDLYNIDCAHNAYPAPFPSRLWTTLLKLTSSERGRGGCRIAQSIPGASIYTLSSSCLALPFPFPIYLPSTALRPSTRTRV